MPFQTAWTKVLHWILYLRLPPGALFPGDCSKPQNEPRRKTEPARLWASFSRIYTGSIRTHLLWSAALITDWASLLGHGNHKPERCVPEVAGPPVSTVWSLQHIFRFGWVLWDDCQCQCCFHLIPFSSLLWTHQARLCILTQKREHPRNTPKRLL